MWYLVLREEQRLNAFVNKTLDEYLDPRGMRLGSGKKFTTSNFIVRLKSTILRWGDDVARMGKVGLF